MPIQLTPEDVTALLNWRAGTGPRPAILDGPLNADELQIVSDAIDRLDQRRSGSAAADLAAAIDRLDRDGPGWPK